uniref:Uncharacterized protein n=1 Tax=Octopus bimaculoides TaxID=37653 RepID=A0A0L8IE53_OCTBM
MYIIRVNICDSNIETISIKLSHKTIEPFQNQNELMCTYDLTQHIQCQCP